MSHIEVTAVDASVTARELAQALLAEGALRRPDGWLLATPTAFRRLVRSSGYLKAHLERDVFDARGAAAFLGVAPNSVVSAAYRRRLPFVQFGAGRLFTLADLRVYAAKRGTTRASKLRPTTGYLVRPDEVLEVSPDGSVVGQGIRG